MVLIEHWPAKQKVYWFDSPSGHMPALRARSQMAVYKRQWINVSLTHCVSLLLFLPHVPSL